jgi:hypothetical protein
MCVGENKFDEFGKKIGKIFVSGPMWDKVTMHVKPDQTV